MGLLKRGRGFRRLLKRGWEKYTGHLVKFLSRTVPSRSSSSPSSFLLRLLPLPLSPDPPLHIPPSHPPNGRASHLSRRLPLLGSGREAERGVREGSGEGSRGGKRREEQGREAEREAGEGAGSCTKTLPSSPLHGGG